MRPLIILSLATSVVAHAQPSFSFALAEDRQEASALARSVAVVQHYRERIPYFGINGSYLGPVQELALEGGHLFRDSKQHWMMYSPVEAVAESYVLVIHEKDTMRIDLPEDPKQLIDRAWLRGERNTPEVIRFRKGRYAVEQLVADPWAERAANTLAKRLIAEDDAAYKQELAELEEYYRNQPPPVPPAPPRAPPPPMTEEDWAAFWAQQPPLKQVRMDRMNADTVCVKITGRVMLNGGCGSGMPLFGIEMHTDSGWVDRIPFDMTQMDCGMSWADWEGHVLMLPPLRWWIGEHQPEGKKAMLPGSYRLFFVGGDLKRMWTEPFAVE